MRLIDADKIDFSEIFVGESEFAQDTRNAAKMLIDAQPTAYDPEKVVEQIVGCDGCSGCCICYEEERMMDCEEYARVYEIVKAGGVE